MLVSCTNEENNIKTITISENKMDDNKSLENKFTKEYDLNELRTFFNNSNINENVCSDSTVSVLKYSDVSNMFPIEIMRTDGYSVYKVAQGGYYYVFWIDSLTKNTSSPPEQYVYFSAYLSSDVDSSIFDSLVPGISTATDVQKIDPWFELSFLRSSGIFSYSYLNDKTIMQIEYEYQENIDGYDDLIVKEKMIVSRNSTPTRYATILSNDLPTKTGDGSLS